MAPQSELNRLASLKTRQQAIEILRRNDRGGYTVPTATGLYPAQWNWDSCFVALGLKLAGEGAHVVVNARANQQEAESVAREARIWGSRRSLFSPTSAKRPKSNHWPPGRYPSSAGSTS